MGLAMVHVSPIMYGSAIPVEVYLANGPHLPGTLSMLKLNVVEQFFVEEAMLHGTVNLVSC